RLSLIASLYLFASMSFLSFSVIHTSSIFSFNAPSPSVLYTLSLHAALPIFLAKMFPNFYLLRILKQSFLFSFHSLLEILISEEKDRKSTRLNSSHVSISYAVFCLKKKKKNIIILIELNTLQFMSVRVSILHN